MNADEDVLIVLPVRSAVLFPGVVLPIAITDKLAIAGAQEAVRTQRRVGLLLQSDLTAEQASPEGLHRVGTAASIVRSITAPDGTHHLVAQGEERFTVLDFVSREPFLVARIDAHREPTVFDQEIEARGLHLREKALEAVQLLPQAPGELTNAIRSVESIPALADMIASFMDLKVVDKQDLLATFDLKIRLEAPHRSTQSLAADRREYTRRLRRAAEGGRAARTAASDSKGAGRNRWFQG
jgi:ATP-dependent Lon protease